MEMHILVHKTQKKLTISIGLIEILDNKNMIYIQKDQFEIIKFRKGDDGKDLRFNDKMPYTRILIRRKK